MSVFRYSRWDGRHEEFSLDVQSALDELSSLMMEGMTAAEALEWMREYGFEMAGLNFRVMGREELQRELQQKLRELYEQVHLDEAMDEHRQRLEEILDREQGTLQQEHGFESARMNEFLARRHSESRRVSEAIERFRDHDFEDEQAGEEFRELLGELDAVSEVEDFIDEEGERFRGSEAADFETTRELMQQSRSLQQMLQRLQSGDFSGISPEELSEILGSDAAQSLILIRDLEDEMRRGGMLAGEDELRLTPRAIRQMGASALADVYKMLRKRRSGDHDTMDRGIAEPRPDETRPWEFGEPLNLDIVRTLMNGIRRGTVSLDPGRRDASGGASVRLDVEDFEVRELDFSTQTTTVLLLDMSWSMSWAGRFPAAKRVALALDHLVRTRFPRDHFFIVGFSTRARELPIRELPEVCWDMGDPFTNLQQGLMVAADLIRRSPSSSPQILVITDGQPTAYVKDGELRVEWPNGMGGISPHAVAETLATVRRVTRQGITINTFMLDDAPELVGFVERMTQINRGRAFYTQPTQLGSFLMVDYVSQRRRRA